MLQKTTWMLYLIIGISIILSSCGKEIIEPFQRVEYTYINKTGIDLSMEIYNTKRDRIKQFIILNNQQITTDTTFERGPALFYFESSEKMIGDSLVLKFVDNNCKYYTKVNQDKVFDFTTYDNYSKKLVSKSEYTLFFTFNENDRSNLVVCE